jgi:hypothetical protein
MVPTTHVAASNITIFGLDDVSHPPSGYKVLINQLATDKEYGTPSGSTDERCHWVNQSLLDELVLRAADKDEVRVLPRSHTRSNECMQLLQVELLNQSVTLVIRYS